VPGVRRVVSAVADAARRWSDADFPPRVRATRAIRERTGYTEPVVDYALDALFGALDADALLATIASELGSPDALETFVSRPGRPDVTYRGVENAAIVSSDTTIGVALPALAFALCAGAHTIVKDRSDLLIASFAQTLAQERPALAERIEAIAWDGADDAATRSHLARADTLVAFGGSGALRELRAHLKADALFVPYGHRTSLGYVERESLLDAESAREVARGIARDALLYDGSGCLSLHAAFVERGGLLDPRAFARIVGDAFDEAALEFPAGYDTDAELAAYLRSASFRASQGRGATFGGSMGPHLVAYDAPADEPPPLARRTLALYPADEPDDALAFVRRHGLPLEAVAFGAAPTRADLTAFARASGASRTAKLGTLQRPPLAGEHGGYERILPFVRAIYRA
jgi:hypothetical protein